MDHITIAEGIVFYFAAVYVNAIGGAFVMDQIVTGMIRIFTKGKVLGTDSFVADRNILAGAASPGMAIANEGKRLRLTLNMQFWDPGTGLESVLPKMYHRVEGLGNHLSQLSFRRLGVRLGHG